MFVISFYSTWNKYPKVRTELLRCVAFSKRTDCLGVTPRFDIDKFPSSLERLLGEKVNYIRNQSMYNTIQNDWMFLKEID